MAVMTVKYIKVFKNKLKIKKSNKGLKKDRHYRHYSHF